MLRLFKLKGLKDSSVRNECFWYEGKSNSKVWWYRSEWAHYEELL